MRSLVVHGRISVVIDCKLKMAIHVFTEPGAMGSPEGAFGV
ncbi:hypothetical protein [Pseudocolwellia agarivorans]